MSDRKWSALDAREFTDALWAADPRTRELEAERDALRAALKPFAALASAVDGLRHADDSTCPHRLKAGDIRRAREALGDRRSDPA